MKFRDFQGLRPPADLAPRVSAVPYDVVSTAEAREMTAHNPLSLLWVSRPEINFPGAFDPHCPEAYAKAAARFKLLRNAGALLPESEPCLYLYQQSTNGHTQCGVVGLVHVDDYDNGAIKRHEHTRPDKEDDRTRITAALDANLGPVFLTFRDDPRLADLISSGRHGRPLYDFNVGGVRHSAWRVSHTAPFLEAFAAVPAAYVADGHHRAASAARVARARRAANPGATGDEDFNWFLAVLFPASSLRILPYNRAVADLNGLQPAAFLERLNALCPLTPHAAPEPPGPRHVSMYLAGEWFDLALEPAPGAGPAARLDVAMLQDRVLAPLLGIDDPRTSPRIEFFGGVRGTKALTDRVDSGAAAVAFSLHPVSVHDMMDIADAGQVMPPKSTWFEPKLRSGLFLHTFESREEPAPVPDPGAAPAPSAA